MYLGVMRLDDVLTVLDAVERAGVRYAVLGGLATAAHGFDRATHDLDLFVAPDATYVERLRGALTEVFDDPDIAMITAEDLGSTYPAVEYGPTKRPSARRAPTTCGIWMSPRIDALHAGIVHADTPEPRARRGFCPWG